MAFVNTDNGYDLEPVDSSDFPTNMSACGQASGGSLPKCDTLKTECQDSTPTSEPSSSHGEKAPKDQMNLRRPLEVNTTPIESGNSAIASSQSSFETQAADLPAESREHAADAENEQKESESEESTFATRASGSFASSRDHATGTENEQEKAESEDGGLLAAAAGVSSHQENGAGLREGPQEEQGSPGNQAEHSSREVAIYSDLRAQAQEAVGRDRRERERQRMVEQQAEPPVWMQEGGAMAVNLRGVRQLREDLRTAHRFYNCCLSCRWERLEVTVMLCGCQILCRWCFLDNHFLWYPGFLCPLCRRPSQGYKFSPDMMAFMLERSRKE